MRQSNLAPAIAKDGTDQVQTHHRRHHGEEGAVDSHREGEKGASATARPSKAQKRRCIQLNLAPAIQKERRRSGATQQQAASRVRRKVLRWPPNRVRRSAPPHDREGAARRYANPGPEAERRREKLRAPSAKERAEVGLAIPSSPWFTAGGACALGARGSTGLCDPKLGIGRSVERHA